MTWRASRRVGSAVLLLAMVVAGVAGCKRSAPEAQPDSAHPPPAERGPAPQATPARAVESVGASTRAARLAGTWYEADPPALAAQLAGYLRAARQEDQGFPPAGALVGVVAPHAGYRFSGRTAASAYRLVQQARPSRVFVLGPTHSERLRGVAVVRATRFDTPLGPIPIDTNTVARLLRHHLFVDHPAADEREHSVEVQMPFIRHVAPRATVVPLIVGQLTLDEVRQVADQIRGLLGRGDLVVASSDFTHYGPRYGYLPFRGEVAAQLRELDLLAFDKVASADIAAFWRFKHETEDTICGFYPVSILMALAGPQARARLLRYDTSGRITGDFENSVSYLAVALYRPPNTAWRSETVSFLAPAEQQRALRLARRAIEGRLHGRSFDPRRAKMDLGGRLAERHGVFVTLKRRRGGQLRGCIGTVQPTKPLYGGIVEHALNAAFHDSRFSPLTRKELGQVDIEVTVLTPPTPVSGPKAITIGRDGVILAKGGRAALFLPQVAVEQGWGLVRTLSALSRKAGLGIDGWLGASFKTFQGYAYHESHH